MDARTHDLFYLREDMYENVKESFKFTLAGALQFAGKKPASALDVGCAAGEFPFFLTRSLPKTRVHAMDVIPELIEKARVKVPNASFTVGSALDHKALSERFEMVFFLGVNSIFDELEPWLSNLIGWTKPGGTLVIYGLINSHPIDTFVRVRTQKDDPSHREQGWNLISRATYEEALHEHPDVADFEFSDFMIPIDIERHDDPLRGWTEKRPDGSRYIINGSGLLHDYKMVCIRKR